MPLDDTDFKVFDRFVGDERVPECVKSEARYVVLGLMDADSVGTEARNYLEVSLAIALEVRIVRENFIAIINGIGFGQGRKCA